jgi:hypothetical protein
LDLLRAAAWSQYEAVTTACQLFDTQQATMLSAAGGDEYATITQLTYRQVPSLNLVRCWYAV